MKKVDIIFALISGEIIAWFFYGILKNLGVDFPGLFLVLAILLPVLALLGLWICWVLGKKFLWIFQAGKFLLVGALATMVDLGVLNFLILISGIAKGSFYSLFKGISFIVATCSKFLGDKFWAFEKTGKERVVKEFFQFFVVTLIGLLINVGSASLIVNVIGEQFGLEGKILANIGGIIAACISAIWNFLGYKHIVFKT